MKENRARHLNLDEMMESIRREIRMRSGAAAEPGFAGSAENPVAERSPDLGASPTLPREIDWLEWDRATQELGIAEQYAPISSLQPQFVDWGRFERAIALRVAQGIMYISQFITNKQAKYNQASVSVLRFLLEALRTLAGSAPQIVARLTDHDNALRALEARLGALDERLEGIDLRLATLAGRRSAAFESMLREERAKLEADALETKTAVAQLESELKQAVSLTQAASEAASEARSVSRGLDARINEIQQQVSDLSSRFSQFKGAQVLRHAVGGVTAGQTGEPRDEEADRLDALYHDFEQLFRGSRQDIKGRNQVYLPRLVQAGVGTSEMPIVDLGCGRGEWLEVLRENGFSARGVDINRVFVEECQKRDLEVVEQDALTFLRSLDGASVGAVTGFHLLEHLPYEQWMRILDETVRVLRPGGLAIFETPNPANLVVGSYSFYLDPSHRNPLPSPMLKFMLEAKGLREVEVVELHPLPESFSGIEPTVAAQLNRYFCGPQDYAVIGRKS